MTISGLIGMAFILIFFGLIIISAAARSSRPGSNLRAIPAFTRLRRAIGLAVESGSRLHISIGRGNITGPKSSAAFVGLSMLGRLAQSASAGDSPPIATTGDPALAILAQDTLSGTYRDIGMIDHYDPAAGQLLGFTPFSYAAGALQVARDEKSAANILAGSFGSEVALLTDAGESGGNLTLAGTDNVVAQAILYATAHEPLIGEELYAGGAYVQAGPMHAASLRAQDIIRWILVAAILGGIVLNVLGFDQIIIDALEGLL